MKIKRLLLQDKEIKANCHHCFMTYITAVTRVTLLCVMSQISHNIRVALQSDLWMRSDISIYRRRWQPLSVHLRSHPVH